jgi:hypothetical protein
MKILNDPYKELLSEDQTINTDSEITPQIKESLTTARIISSLIYSGLIFTILSYLLIPTIGIFCTLMIACIATFYAIKKMNKISDQELYDGTKTIKSCNHERTISELSSDLNHPFSEYHPQSIYYRYRDLN